MTQTLPHATMPLGKATHSPGSWKPPKPAVAVAVVSGLANALDVVAKKFVAGAEVPNPNPAAEGTQKRDSAMRTQGNLGGNGGGVNMRVSAYAREVRRYGNSRAGAAGNVVVPNPPKPVEAAHRAR